MMMRRRPVVRTAVVGGAGYMAGKSAAKKATAEQDQNARIDALEKEQSPPPAPPPAAAPAPAQGPAASAGGADTVEQLGKLADLHKAGALSDDEFAAAKKSLLGL